MKFSNFQFDEMLPMHDTYDDRNNQRYVTEGQELLFKMLKTDARLI